MRRSFQFDAKCDIYSSRFSLKGETVANKVFRIPSRCLHIVSSGIAVASLQIPHMSKSFPEVVCCLRPQLKMDPLKHFCLKSDSSDGKELLLAGDEIVQLQNLLIDTCGSFLYSCCFT